MTEAYREEPLPFEKFITIMREAKQKVVAGIMAKVELYTGLECSLEENILSLGATKVEVNEDIVEYDYHKKSNLIPPVELAFASKRLDKRAGDIGLGFYYSSSLKVHTVTIFNELTSYPKFKDYIYNHSYSFAEFLLKELEDDSFIELLVDELFFQLAWNIPELNYHMMKSSAPDFTKTLLKEIKLRRFVELFQEKGFTVSGGQIYCSTAKSKLLPEEEKLLKVNSDNDRAVYAFYSIERGAFCRADNREELSPVYFWRYVEEDEMQKLLEAQGLKGYRRYILPGDGGRESEDGLKQ